MPTIGRVYRVRTAGGIPDIVESGDYEPTAQW
jgi:hypothetical protein